MHVHVHVFRNLYMYMYVPTIMYASMPVHTMYMYTNLLTLGMYMYKQRFTYDLIFRGKSPYELLISLNICKCMNNHLTGIIILQDPERPKQFDDSVAASKV